MAQEKLKDLQPGPASKRSRFELRIMLAILLAVVVAGGAYVAIFGSPTKGRAALDSSSRGPGVLGQPARTSIKPGH